MNLDFAACELRPLINHSELNDRGLYVKDIRASQHEGSNGCAYYIYDIWFHIKGIDGESKIQVPAFSLDLNQEAMLVFRINKRLKNILGEFNNIHMNEQTKH